MSDRVTLDGHSLAHDSRVVGVCQGWNRQDMFVHHWELVPV